MDKFCKDMTANFLLNVTLVIVGLIACALCLFSGLYVSGLLLLCLLLLKLYFALSVANSLLPAVKVASEILKMFRGTGAYAEARVFALSNTKI